MEDRCRCRHCSDNSALIRLLRWDYDGKTGEDGEEWDDLQYMACPPRVLGFVIREKYWAQLDFARLTEVREDPTGLERLRFGNDEEGQHRKSLLLSLVKHHGTVKATDGESQGYVLNDITADKGKGLVVLLYGTPGVGKTSTALMIAAAARRPLLPVSVSDVGTEAEDIESRLQAMFAIATRWKAILLIDEADVFLQSRTLGSLGPSVESSGLVSTFLRALEYYPGILFLTTNQIASFDIAVHSRIHIAMKYEHLRKDQAQAIFMDLIEQYDHERAINGLQEFQKFADKELYKKKFDGRQIRNLVICAMGWAQAAGKKKMSVSDVRDVSALMEDYKSDLAGEMQRWQDRQNKTSF